jgi:hypothetical protein
MIGACGWSEQGSSRADVPRAAAWVGMSMTGAQVALSRVGEGEKDWLQGLLGPKLGVQCSILSPLVSYYC